MSARDSALFLEVVTLIRRCIPQHMLQAPLEGDVEDVQIMSMDEGE